LLFKSAKDTYTYEIFSDNICYQVKTTNIEKDKWKQQTDYGNSEHKQKIKKRIRLGLKIALKK